MQADAVTTLSISSVGGLARGRVARCAVVDSASARSASTGWRVMSLRDTARSRAIASLHRRAARCRRGRRSDRAGRSGPAAMPSTFAHAAASRCSVGVAGGVDVPPRRHRARRRARSAPSCRSCRWRSAAARSRQWNADGTMYSRQRLTQPIAEQRRASSGLRRRSRRPPAACCGRPARRRRRRASRTPGTRSSAFSISPISIRKPRILTWLSRRPRNSSFPSGSQRP